MQSHFSVQAVSPTRRRRSSSGEPLKKITLQLHESVVDAIKTVVDAGEAPSQNVFVEEAVRDKLRDRRRARVYAAYEEASNDPTFMCDMDEDVRAFDVTLSDDLPIGR